MTRIAGAEIARGVDLCLIIAIDLLTDGNIRRWHAI